MAKVRSDKGVEKRPADERFWEKVNKNGPTVVPELGNCWLWTAALMDTGYGAFYFRRRIRAHHYLLPQPAKGWEWDHLCRVRRCVRPSHLELVTKKVNGLRGISPPAQNARKTECIHGHPLSGDNLIIRPSGVRLCRTCRTEQNQRGWQRRLARRTTA